MMIEKLNRAEILRYLGYRDSGVTEPIERLLSRCEKETLEIIQPKYIYRRFEIERCPEGIRVSGTPLVLEGKDIQEHLKNCREIFLLGVTAGMELDKRIRRYMVTEPDAGVVMVAAVPGGRTDCGFGGKRAGAGGSGQRLSSDLAFQPGLWGSSVGDAERAGPGAGYSSENRRVFDRKLSDGTGQIRNGDFGNQRYKTGSSGK